MKFLVSLLAFALVLGLSYATLANEGAKSESNHEKSHPDMNALYPTKQPDHSKTTPPAKPSLVEPKFMDSVSGDKVTLKWESVSGATNYQLQVATDPAFKWLVNENREVAGTTYDVSGLEKGKKYYWRVWSQINTNDVGAQTSLANWSAFLLK